MTKSTKRPLPVSKTIQFQQHQKIKDISVSGKDALTSVDFSERDGDFKLKVKADPDKVNEVSGTPFVTTTVTTADEGTDDPKKSVTLGHDYRGLALETAGKYLRINKTQEKAVIDGTLIEADLTKALNDAKDAKAKAEQANAKADDLAKKLEDAKTKEVSDITSVTDAVTKLGEASKTADGELKKAIDALAEKLKNANTTNSAEPLKVTDESKRAIMQARMRQTGLESVDFVVGGETVTVTYRQENVNKTGYEDNSTHDFSHGLKTSNLGGLNGGTGLFVSLKYDTENRVLTNIVTDIHFASYERSFATDLIKIRDWLKFPPLTPAKALLQLSQAKGRTNFTQDDLDSGVVVSGGLLVDLGEYWLPVHVSVSGTSVTFSGTKEDAQALLDFDIKTYNVDTAEVETVNAKTLLEPGTKVPPILKTVY